MRSLFWSKFLEWLSKWKINKGNFLTYKDSKTDNLEDLKTSLTLDYRKRAWGIERIVLDMVSNHLSADSEATKFSVEYLQDGKLVDFREWSDAKPVEKATIKDNGRGFDYKLLEVLYSTKNDDKQSIGQFGEGLKLASSACLREGINIEFHSRDWFANPYAKDEKIEEKDIQRLHFKVEKNKPRIEGSETIFYNPDASLIEMINKLPELVLAFNDKHKTLFSSNIDGYVSKIIGLKSEENALFVKGIRIKKGGKEHFDSIFSYDLGIEDISPDRQFADESKVRESIKMLLQNCDNKEIHKEILMSANQNPDRDLEEYKALGYELIGEKSKKQELSSADEIWKQMFYDVFGKKSVLVSENVDCDKDALALGYNVIKLNKYLGAYMSNIGIESASDLLQTENKFKWVDKDELSSIEVKMLDLIPRINKILLNSDIEIDVRIYDGEYSIRKSIDGHILREEEVEIRTGFHTEGLIGIKRTQLKTKRYFINTYVHELGHEITGKGDYNREFTEFFTVALTKLLDKRLNYHTTRKKGLNSLF